MSTPNKSGLTREQFVARGAELYAEAVELTFRTLTITGVDVAALSSEIVNHIVAAFIAGHILGERRAEQAAQRQREAGQS